jgi:hypothetical protein
MFAWEHPLLIALIAGLLGPLAAILLFVVFAQGRPGEPPTQLSDRVGYSASLKVQQAGVSQGQAKH